MKRLKNSLIISLSAFLFLSFFSVEAIPCTHFQLKAKDGSVIIGRSMEFALELKSDMVVHSRGERRNSMAPNGSRGVEWTSQYGYIAANALGLDTAIDGFNEMGLSVGGLWLPKATQYPSVPEDQSHRALSVMDLGAWLLGNFANVEQVKEALKTVRVWGPEVPQLKMVPPLHWAIHDTSGRGLVVEFLDGEMKVYDNDINGVLTNYPPFEWQIINLQNYVNLKALNAGPIDVEGSVLGPTGQGSGLLGIPGDWTPPSRFVRVTAFKQFARPAGNAADGVNLADHLLFTVDIPIGTIIDKPGDSAGDYTQWIVIKDLKNLVMYFRTYENPTLRSIDLKKLDLGPRAPVRITAMHGGTGIVDISDQLRGIRPAPEWMQPTQ